MKELGIKEVTFSGIDHMISLDPLRGHLLAIWMKCWNQLLTSQNGEWKLKEYYLPLKYLPDQTIRLCVHACVCACVHRHVCVCRHVFGVCMPVCVCSMRAYTLTCALVCVICCYTINHHTITPWLMVQQVLVSPYRTGDHIMTRCTSTVLVLITACHRLRYISDHIKV